MSLHPYIGLKASVRVRTSATDDQTFEGVVAFIGTHGDGNLEDGLDVHAECMLLLDDGTHRAFILDDIKLLEKPKWNTGTSESKFTQNDDDKIIEAYKSDQMWESARFHLYVEFDRFTYEEIDARLNYLLNLNMRA